MSEIRGFSSGEGLVPATRTIDSDAPDGFRQELVDAIFHIAAQTGGQLADIDLYRIGSQCLGVAASGAPYSGPRYALGRDLRRASWERVYDLIVRLWPEFSRVGHQDVFREAINRLLSAYGIAWELDESGALRRVLPPAVQAQIEAAMRELEQPRFAAAKELLGSAIEAYDARPRRDRDAGANSFHALEAVAKVVFGMPTATCGAILQASRAQNAFDPHIQTVLEALNTNRNRNYGHGVPFTLTAPEVDFTYLANIAGLLLIARRP